MREVVTSALRPYGTTIFTEMTALANSTGAINLSQGFPDTDGPVQIRQKAAEAILRGPNQYAPSIGLDTLRQAVSRHLNRFYGLSPDPEMEVTITSGGTEGLCATLLGILEPGDEVILLEPCFDTYAPVVSMAGARCRFVSLEGTDFSLPRKRLEEAFGPMTKAIIINNPQNPCGKVFSRDELSFIGGLCQSHDAFAIGDEVYEHLVYDGRSHVPLLSIPELKDRSFVISSTGKTFSMTGWKIGYVVASPELSRAVRMSHQFIVFCGQPALQEAMAFAMDLPDRYYNELRDDYQRRRDYFYQELSDMGFKAYVSEGTYYLLIDIRSVGFSDDLEFCRMLPRDAGVAAIPCSFFWEQRKMGRELVRFCFCKRDETLKEAITRLRRWKK